MENSTDELSTLYASKPIIYYDYTRPEMLLFIPIESKKILDVGCSSGGFGALLKKERPDVEVWGIEPNPEAADIAAQRLDKVINGVFQPNDPEVAGQKFDVIVFNDVLEHMVYPENALNACKEYLAPQGVVVASIPNILYFAQIAKILLFQDWKYEDAGILDRTHLRFFTKKSIIRMFEECGYRVLKIEGLSKGFNLKYSLLTIFSLGHCRNWRHGQFAVQATPC